MEFPTRVVDAYILFVDKLPNPLSLTDAIDALCSSKIALHDHRTHLPIPTDGPFAFHISQPFDEATLKYIFLCMVTDTSVVEVRVFHGDICIQLRLGATHVFDPSEVLAVVNLCANIEVYEIIVYSSDHNVRETYASTVADMKKRVKGGEDDIHDNLGRAVATFAPRDTAEIKKLIDSTNVKGHAYFKKKINFNNNENETYIKFVTHYFRLSHELKTSQSTNTSGANDPLCIGTDGVDQQCPQTPEQWAEYEATMIDSVIERARARGFMFITLGQSDVDWIYEKTNMKLFYKNHIKSVNWPKPEASYTEAMSINNSVGQSERSVHSVISTFLDVYNNMRGEENEVRTWLSEFPYINIDRCMDEWNRLNRSDSTRFSLGWMLLYEALVVNRIMYDTGDKSPFSELVGEEKLVYRLVLFGFVHYCFATLCMCSFIDNKSNRTYNEMTRMYANAPRMLEHLFEIRDLKGRVLPAAYQSGYMNGSWQRFTSSDSDHVITTVYEQGNFRFRVYEDRPVWCWNTDDNEGGYDMYDMRTDTKLLFDKLSEKRGFVSSGRNVVTNIFAVQGISISVTNSIVSIVNKTTEMLGWEKVDVDHKALYDSVCQSVSIASPNDIHNMYRWIWPVDVIFHMLHGVAFILLHWLNEKYSYGSTDQLIEFVKDIPKRILLTDIMCALENAGILTTIMYIGTDRSVIDPIASTVLKWTVYRTLGKDSWVNIWRNSRLLITKMRKGMLYFSVNEIKLILNVAMHGVMHYLVGDDNSRKAAARMVSLLNPVDFLIEKSMRAMLVWTWVYSIASIVLQKRVKDKGLV